MGEGSHTRSRIISHRIPERAKRLCIADGPETGVQEKIGRCLEIGTADRTPRQAPACFPRSYAHRSAISHAVSHAGRKRRFGVKGYDGRRGRYGKTWIAIVDWTGCELVERIPGKVSGRPVVRDTRFLADTIVQHAELGSSLEEIHENYPDLSLAANSAANFVCSRASRTARTVGVLFDHNLPHKPRTHLGTLGKHEIITTSYMRWAGLKNGELLQAAEENSFEVLVTGDQSLVYEQNLTGRRLGIIAPLQITGRS